MSGLRVTSRETRPYTPLFSRELLAVERVMLEDENGNSYGFSRITNTDVWRNTWQARANGFPIFSMGDEEGRVIDRVKASQSSDAQALVDLLDGN